MDCERFYNYYASLSADSSWWTNQLKGFDRRGQTLPLKCWRACPLSRIEPETSCTQRWHPIIDLSWQEMCANKKMIQDGDNLLCVLRIKWWCHSHAQACSEIYKLLLCHISSKANHTPLKYKLKQDVFVEHLSPAPQMLLGFTGGNCRCHLYRLYLWHMNVQYEHCTLCR